MELLVTLGRTLGFSFAAGINLYATVAILGLASRFDWVSLPPQFKVFDNDIVIAAAIVMYIVEFFADKIPWLDSVWDTVHTAIRPIGGALIAVATLGDASPILDRLGAARPRRQGGRGHRTGRHSATRRRGTGVALACADARRPP